MHFFIHPLFFVVGFAAVVYSAVDFLLALIVSVLLHECAHFLVAKKYGAVVARISLMPFGGALNLKTKILTQKQKMLIYLAGPLASFCFSILFGVLVWLFPTIFIYLEYLVVANFLIGLINILPIYPLDGGKVFVQYIPMKVMVVISNVFFGIMLLWSLITFRWWWIFFVVTILLQTNIEFKQNLYFDKFTYSSRPKIGKIVRCAVLSSTSLLTSYKMIDKKRPTEFIVTDMNQYVFGELELEKWLINKPFNTCIQNCIK